MARGLSLRARSFDSGQGSGRFGNVAKVAVVLLLLTEVAVLLLLEARSDDAATSADGFGSQRPPTVAAEQPNEATRGEFARVTSKAGYSLAYPQSWRVERSGSSTQIIAPGRRGIVSAGVAAPGDARRVAADFTASLRRLYSDIRVERRSSRRVGEEVVVIAAGNCANARGVPLEFQTVLKGDGERNFVMAAFVDVTAPRPVRARMLSVASSFALLGSV